MSATGRIAVFVFDLSNCLPYTELLKELPFSISEFKIGRDSQQIEDVSAATQNSSVISRKQASEINKDDTFIDTYIVELNDNLSVESQSELFKKVWVDDAAVVTIVPDGLRLQDVGKCFLFCNPIKMTVRNAPDTLFEVMQSLFANHQEISLIRNPQIQSENFQDSFIPGVVGKSHSLKATIGLARRIANCSATTLITGESGVGKEIFAKAIHLLGDRKLQPFVAINCSAIPESLLESELFGHAKGSFTGAFDKRVGLFEEANKGTLFLDEIGDLSPVLQVKLLRVLQEKRIRRVGENVFRAVDVRIVAATHKDLAAEVLAKTFREDLFFRLNVIDLTIPPLRKRKDDIIPLAYHFLKTLSSEDPRLRKVLSDETALFLTEQEWHGNVRELANAIERSLVMSDNNQICISDLEMKHVEPLNSETTIFSEHRHETMTVETLVNKYVMFILKKNHGLKEKTAKELDIDPKTLNRRIRCENLTEFQD